MRTLYLFNMVTLDGFFEGATKGEIDWHNVDAEFNDFAIDQLNATDLIIFGRVTYEGMASYWPTPMAIENDPVVAGKMNAIAKVVISRNLKKAEWNNTRLIKSNIVDEIMSLKKQPGKDMAIFGSADLASTFINHGLIDEFRIIVNPILLGNGSPLFKKMSQRIKLKLAKARTFKSGNVLLIYTV